MKGMDLIFSRIMFIVSQIFIEYIFLPAIVAVGPIILFELPLIALAYAITGRIALEYVVRIITGAYFSEKYSRQGR